MRALDTAKKKARPIGRAFLNINNKPYNHIYQLLYSA